jgi:hypothetical protein
MHAFQIAKVFNVYIVLISNTIYTSNNKFFSLESNFGNALFRWENSSYKVVLATCKFTSSKEYD